MLTLVLVRRYKHKKVRSIGVCYSTANKTFPRELGPILRMGRTLLHCPVTEPDIVTAKYSFPYRANTAYTVPYSVVSSSAE